MSRPSSRVNREARIGVCTWSLRPTGPEDLVEKVRATGLSAVHLAIDPLRTLAWPADEVRRQLAEADIDVLAGMMSMAGEDYSTLSSIRETGGVRIDALFTQNLAAARANAELCRDLRVPLITFHAGFIPHAPDDPLRETMIERLHQVTAIFREYGVRCAFETGQESAETLLDVLREFPEESVGVNFDPANMILYGMGDPIDALRRLAPRVFQVHIKDATPSATPGEWGEEVVVGEGAVDWAAFFRVLAELRPDVDRCIEREAGETRIDDVRAACAVIERGRG